MDKITQKIMEETGLNSEEIKYYELFCDHAGLTDRVIMYDDVKFEFRRLIKEGNNKETPESHRHSKERTYDYWLNVFKDKGLIHRFEAQYNSSFPVLKGYRSYDDPEFYIAYRKRGDKGWNGRFSTELLSTVGEKLLAKGYELR